MTSAYDRTPERPMAFAPAEFWRGALTAWGVFVLILVVGIFLTTVAAGEQPGWGQPLPLALLSSGYALVLGGLVSGAVVLIISPLARLLGRALAGVRNVWIHLVAFAVLGGAIGLAVVFVQYLQTNRTGLGMFSNSWTWVVVGVCSVSVAAGWAHAAFRALRTRS